jgi:hypothetical protein
MAAARFMKASSSQRYQQRQSSMGGGTNGHSTSGLPRTATTTEGVDATGGRFVRPEPASAAGAAPPPGGASGVDTPTTGVIPPGR